MILDTAKANAEAGRLLLGIGPDQDFRPCERVADAYELIEQMRFQNCGWVFTINCVGRYYCAVVFNTVARSLASHTDQSAALAITVAVLKALRVPMLLVHK